jgi:hypothetical protein
MFDRSRTVGSLGMVVALALAAGASAQEGGRTVSGVLTDAATGDPIAYALVEVPSLDLSAVTDSAGRFALADVPTGTHRFWFTQLGYYDRGEDLIVPDAAPVRMTLAPRPVELEGLKVMASRFASRRNSVPVSYRVLEREELAEWNGDALRFLRSRGGISLTSCSGREWTDQAWCLYRRGRKIEPRVYLDDMPAFIGLDVLSAYETPDLYAIEILDRGSMVRIYTRQFLSEVANKPRVPTPLWW